MRWRVAGALGVTLLLAFTAIVSGQAVTTRHQLANGLRLLVREDSTAGVVAASLQVRAGSRSEPAEKTGITNFLLRVMVRGAGRRSAAEIAEAADVLGGVIEASGDVESGEIRGRALARHGEALLGLIADIVREPTLPPVEIERERRLILSQIQTRADNPFPLTFDTLLQDLYGRHPYGVSALGRRASVEGISREDLLAHYRAIVRADRIVLAVSGRIEAARVVRAVEARFGGVPAATDPLPEAVPVPVSRAARRVVEHPARQAQILVGYLAPGVTEPDYAAVKVLGALLGGGMAGRLFATLRDEEGLAYSLGVLMPSRSGPGYLIAHLGTAPENAASAEAAMIREITRVGEEAVTERELARATAYLRGTLAGDRRTNERRAWYLAHFEVIGAGWDFPDRYARSLPTVTAADVQRAARRYLAHPTSVVLQPR